MTMETSTERIYELAEQKQENNILEIKLKNNNIGSAGRTHIEVVDRGEDFIEANLVEMLRTSADINEVKAREIEQADFIEHHDTGDGATLWFRTEGKYLFNPEDISTVRDSTMIDGAEEQ